MAKGMMMGVLRDANGGDCTNGGLSSKVRNIVVTGPGIAEIFEPSSTAPEFKLVKRWAGTPNEYLHLEPVDQPSGGCGPMAGGNFAYTSDGRMRDICAYPIPIHDRFETQAQYNSNF